MNAMVSNFIWKLLTYFHESLFFNHKQEYLNNFYKKSWRKRQCQNTLAHCKSTVQCHQAFISAFLEICNRLPSFNSFPLKSSHFPFFTTQKFLLCYSTIKQLYYMNKISKLLGKSTLSNCWHPDHIHYQILSLQSALSSCSDHCLPPPLLLVFLCQPL